MEGNLNFTEVHVLSYGSNAEVILSKFNNFAGDVDSSMGSAADGTVAV